MLVKEHGVAALGYTDPLMACVQGDPDTQFVVLRHRIARRVTRLVIWFYDGGGSSPRRWKASTLCERNSWSLVADRCFGSITTSRYARWEDRVWIEDGRRSVYRITITIIYSIPKPTHHPLKGPVYTLPPPLPRPPLVPPRSLRHTHHLRVRVRTRRQRFIRHLLLQLLVVASLAKLVHPREIDLVRPALIEVDEENDVIAESGEAVQSRHFDGEGEEVVDEGVEEFVRHGFGGHVRYALSWASGLVCCMVRIFCCVERGGGGDVLSVGS